LFPLSGWLRRLSIDGGFRHHLGAFSGRDSHDGCWANDEMSGESGHYKISKIFLLLE
jgi:hypothetical protein